MVVVCSEGERIVRSNFSTWLLPYTGRDVYVHSMIDLALNLIYLPTEYLDYRSFKKKLNVL